MSGPLRILVVDDDAAIRMLLEELLDDAGYEVRAVPSAEQALEVLRADRHHLVITDIRLEGRSGLVLLQEIKNDPVLRDVEVVVMTSYGSLDTAVSAIRLGARDYLFKPFDNLDAVLEVVRRCGDMIHLSQENRRLVDALSHKNRELEKANRALTNLNRELGALIRLAFALSTTLERREVTRYVCSSLAEIFPGVRTWFFAPAEDSRLAPLMPVASSHPMDDAVSALRIAVESGDQPGFADGDERGRAAHNLAARVGRELSDYVGVEVGRVRCEPVVSEGEVLGVLAAAGGDAIHDRLHKVHVYLGAQLSLCLSKVQLYQRMKHMALRDGLTGCYNHRYFQERIKQEVERSRRYGHPLSLLFIDVDHFKAYNDLNGHFMGDMVLRELARLMTKSGRASDVHLHLGTGGDNQDGGDVLARYGGEEFAIILPETEHEGAVTKAEHMRAMVAEHPFSRRDRSSEGRITISVGVATFPEHARDAQSLITVADEALYKSKNLGRNRVTSAATLSTTP